MRTDIAHPVRLEDYRPPDYLIDSVELDVLLHPSQTHVRCRLQIHANPRGRAGAPLRLDGDGLNVVGVSLDGAPLDLATTATPEALTLACPPSGPFSLDIETLVDAKGNTQLSGLYRSGSAYCTQCEAEGFRRITYFLDRPDVLSLYTTRIEAEKTEAPVLLSNGNYVEGGDVAGTTRHYAIWRDPHPKPSYLFALVAGDLGALRDAYTTASGRRVELAIHVEHGNEPRAAYAMDALKRAMRWDEEKFGREYDLDIFNIVAVSDFNMGAMENKGLNVFNDKYVLASPQTATDADYAGIESVIAHEYFHNWTGNRITCRDWFQLCLKEGLTVFRDQEFSADQRSRAVKRIADVRTLRASQFPEDSGPLAHNVRPHAYLEINNFYTPTIYEKGAEVIRMLRLLIGDAAFRRGMDLYFERYDGTAAIVEEFISCFAESSGRDLTHFRLWYDQAGTPVVRVKCAFDEPAHTLTLELAQHTPPTPGQNDKKPLVLPLALGLIGVDGADIELTTPGASHPGGATAAELQRGVFELTGATRRLVFTNVRRRPTLSMLRGFSAPVRLETEASQSDLLAKLAHDSDLFNRWQASQTLANQLLIHRVAGLRAGGGTLDAGPYIDALRCVLDAHLDDNDFAGLAISLPGEADIAREIGKNIDPDAIHQARVELKQTMGRQLAASLAKVEAALEAPQSAFSPDAKSAGARALRNASLDLQVAADASTGAMKALARFRAANNMTDKYGALIALAQAPGEARETALEEFFQEFRGDALVIDKWFALQAGFADPDTLSRVRRLMKHELFSMTNPNRLRSLVGAFSVNPTQFNAADGSGYAFLASFVIELDVLNPQVAARLLGAFRMWRSLEPARRTLAQAALQDVALRQNLSADVRDIVDRSLA